MVVYATVFSIFVRSGVRDYTLFVFCGLLPWIWFSSSLNESTTSITEHGELLKKVYIPSYIFPLVCVCANFLHYLLTLPILFAFLWLKSIKVTPLLVVLPLLWMLQTIFTYGCTLSISALSVIFRDLSYIVLNSTNLLFFLTPILYKSEIVPPEFKFILYANPMYYFITSYQDVFFFHTLSSLKVLMAALLSIVVLLLGICIFRFYNDLFFEEI
jgi:ABC-type polysaccharide/polyol phosphate export permease